MAEGRILQHCGFLDLWPLCRVSRTYFSAQSIIVYQEKGEQSNFIHPNSTETGKFFQFLPRSFSALLPYHRVFLLNCLYLFHLLFNLQIEAKVTWNVWDYAGNSGTWVIYTNACTTFIPCPRFSWDKASLCLETASFLHSVVCHSKLICRVPQTLCWQKNKHLPSGSSWLAANAIFVSNNSVWKVQQFISSADHKIGYICHSAECTLKEYVSTH